MDESIGKVCVGCGVFKPYEEYSLFRAMKDGRQPKCKECNKAYAKQRYAENKDEIKRKARWNHLKYRFGLTREQYEDLLAKQDGKCAICHTTVPGGRANVFMVDHDHSCCAGYATCGECVRGLLCNECNNGLGRFRDNPYLLNRAADYVQQAKLENGRRFAEDVLGLKPIEEG